MNVIGISGNYQSGLKLKRCNFMYCLLESCKDLAVLHLERLNYRSLFLVI